MKTGNLLKMQNLIKVEIVSGCEGESLYINDYRVSGSKPWGGGRVIKSFKTSTGDILESLGLSDYQKIKEENEKLRGLLKRCYPSIKEEKDNWVQQGYWDAGKKIIELVDLLKDIENELLKPNIKTLTKLRELYPPLTIKESYLEELFPEFRKGEVRRDEVTFYKEKKDE